LRRPDADPRTAARPATPGPLARRDGEPAFDEPWQAQVMALAFTLVQQGAFSNARWSATLGARLQAAEERGEPDDAATYYRAALAALEALLAETGRIAHEDLAARTEAWRRAYLNTPHGQPVTLA
jgi:nitrile hydratase accessory protein